MHADGEGRQGEAGTRAIPRQRTRTEEGERWRLGSTDAERERNPQRGILRLAILSRILTLFLMVLHDAVFRDLSTSAHLQAYPCSWSEQHTGARGPGGARGVGALELAAGQGLPTGDVDATPLNRGRYVRHSQLVTLQLHFIKLNRNFVRSDVDRINKAYRWNFKEVFPYFLSKSFQ